VTVLVDTDILIEVCRGADQELLSRWSALSQSDGLILYSPVTLAELLAGARSGEQRALINLFHALACAPIDAATAARAAEYLRKYQKSHRLELGDALIASAAYLNHAKLWTLDRKHYPMKGLSLY
jgi:hypothetical protein